MSTGVGGYLLLFVVYYLELECFVQKRPGEVVAHVLLAQSIKPTQRGWIVCAAFM